MKRTSLFLIILSLLCILSGRDADAASAQEHRYAVVYLDPHYGGRENGAVPDYFFTRRQLNFPALVVAGSGHPIRLVGRDRADPVGAG